MPTPLNVRKQQHSEWEKSVLNAVKTLNDAAKTKENPPNIIKLIGQEIFAALSTQAREDKKAREAHISAALITVESFLKQQQTAQLCELGELASQTLARFQIAYEHSSSKKRFEKSVGTKQQEVNERISHLRPQTQALKPDARLLFNTKYLTTNQSGAAYKQEVDALRLKASGLYSAHYQTPPLDSLSVVQNGYIHACVQKGSDEELEKDPEYKIAHLQIMLTNPVAGEIALVEGAFRRTTKGASRSVPISTSFTLKPEVHHTFPLCIQGPAFCWAHPEKLFQESTYWKQIEESKKVLLLRPERLELNKQFRMLKSDLFKEHGHELSALVEELVSAIIYRANSADQTWKTAVRDFFASLAQRQDPFTYLATVHQRLQTLLIVRPLQQMDQLHSLNTRLAEANSAELESLRGRLDSPTHAYLQCTNQLLLPHTTQTLLARQAGQVSDWHKLAQQHAQMQASDFCQQLSYTQVPSKEELKQQLTQQLSTQTELWKSVGAPAA